MTCASCVAHVGKAVRSLKGVKDCNVNLLTSSMLVSYEDSVKDEDIIKAVEKAGYQASLPGSKSKTGSLDEDFKDTETPKLLKRLIISLVLLVPLFYIGMGYMLNMQYHQPIFPLGAFGENELLVGLTEMSLALVIMFVNRKFFTSGIKALIHRQPNMDTLIALGSGVSFFYSFIMMFVMAFYAKENNWSEVMRASMNLSFETSGMVPTLITIGKTLESYSKGRSTDAIKGLLDLAPKNAHVIRDGKQVTIPIDEVRLEDTFIVLPGENFPVDGIVIEGESSVNESALSGESLPVDKSTGSKVSAATTNLNGSLTCKATRIGNDTTLHQIVKMVETASSTKTKISRIADQVAGIFVPIVMSISLLVFLCWLIFGGDFVSSLGETTRLTYAIERAISVLVISCPCALGLATPVAIMVASGKGAQNGILFKTASAMEETGKVDFVVLDKTGTITKGKPEVKEICPVGISEENLLSIACSLEAKSEHPLSKAVTEKGKERNIPVSSCQSFQSLPGHGIKGTIDGVSYFAGNESLMKEHSLMTEEVALLGKEHAKKGETPLFFAREDSLLGVIFVADSIKEDSALAISKMQESGIEVVMLTGDNATTARVIADEVHIRHVISDVLPQGKLSVIKELRKYGKVAMVGDGINDAPSLTQADIGIAIGAGSDIAIDSADVILSKSTLMDAFKAIQLSRQTLKNIKENLFWAFFYNIVMIPIAAGCFSAIGLAKLRPWMGAASMALSSLCVVLNALRLNLYSFKRTGRKHTKTSFPESLSSDSITKEDKLQVRAMKISDMMCENCVSHVKKALESLKGVTKADVSLDTLKARITLSQDVDDEVLLKAVREAGYMPKMVHEKEER